MAQVGTRGVLGPWGWELCCAVESSGWATFRCRRAFCSYALCPVEILDSKPSVFSAFLRDFGYFFEFHRVIAPGNYFELKKDENNKN
jgi:hypothetical protein